MCARNISKHQVTKRCGFVAVVGRPNVGKSTFVNALVGQKISIVSHRRQTTRGVVRAICERGAAQLILLDSPGWQKSPGGAMNRRLNQGVEWAAASSDVVVFMRTPFTHDEDAECLSRLPSSAVVIAAINKIDQLDNKRDLLPIVADLQQQRDFAAIMPLCARQRRGVATVADEVAALLPSSPALFTDTNRVDAAEDRNFLLAEFLREKMFRALGDELPYRVGVLARQEAMHENIVRVQATIYVERDSQKAIVIGKNGAMLKKLGTAARRDMERIIGYPVYLQTRVVVRSAWQRDANLLAQMRVGAPD